MPVWERPVRMSSVRMMPSGLGRGQVMLAEPDEDAAVTAGDLAGGHGGDTRQLLAVEQEQAASGPVGEVEGVIVQQPGYLCPPLVLGGSGAVVVGGGRDVQVRAVAAGCGPEQEVSRLAGSRPGAQPQVNVSLRACGQAGAAVAEPGEQADRHADVVSRVSCASAVPVVVAGAGTQPPHHVPGDVGLDQRPVAVVGDRAEDAGGPLLSAGEAFVAGWQDPAGGEHVPQVVSGPLTWVSVQRLVGCGEAAGGDVGEQDGTRSAAEPVQRAARLACGGDRFEHARQVRRDVTEPCG